MAGAVKEIQIRIPQMVQLYYVGGASNVVHSAVSLDKKREESSSGLPETNHSKSMAGKKQYCLLPKINHFVPLVKTLHSQYLSSLG